MEQPQPPLDAQIAAFLMWAIGGLAALFSGAILHVHGRISGVVRSVEEDRNSILTQQNAAANGLRNEIAAMRQADLDFRSQILGQMATRTDVSDLRAAIERVREKDVRNG